MVTDSSIELPELSRTYKHEKPKSISNNNIIEKEITNNKVNHINLEKFPENLKQYSVVFEETVNISCEKELLKKALKQKKIETNLKCKKILALIILLLCSRLCKVEALETRFSVHLDSWLLNNSALFNQVEKQKKSIAELETEIKKLIRVI